MAGLCDTFSLAAAMVLVCLFAPSVAAQLQARRCAELLQNAQPAEAESCARAVLASDRQSALAYEILGAIRLQQKNYPTSVQMLREAVRLEPMLMGARTDLGNALFLEGKLAEAERAFRDVLRRSPDNFNAAFALVRVEYAQAHYSQSLVAAQPLLPQLRSREDGLAVLIPDALELKDKVALAGFIQDWAALDHPSLATSLALGQLLNSRQYPDEAIQLLNLAALNNPGEFDPHFLLGELFAKTGVREKATDEYAAAVAIHGDCLRCLYELGRLADAGGQPAPARMWLLRAQAINPRDVEVLTGLGKVCLELDLPDEAINDLATAVKLQPASDPAQYLLASAYTSNKDFHSSLAILKRLAEHRPDDPLLPYSIGSVLYLSGDYAGAEAQLRKSLALHPRDVGSLYYLGLTLRRQERLDEAQTTFLHLLANAPRHSPGLTALGEVLFTEMHYDRAKTVLEQAVALDPSSRNAHYLLGRSLARLGMRDASQQQFAILETLAPGN